jgi:hypothetical protein
VWWGRLIIWIWRLMRRRHIVWRLRIVLRRRISAVRRTPVVRWGWRVHGISHAGRRWSVPRMLMRPLQDHAEEEASFLVEDRSHREEGVVLEETRGVVAKQQLPIVALRRD